MAIVVAVVVVVAVAAAAAAAAVVVVVVVVVVIGALVETRLLVPLVGVIAVVARAVGPI